MPARTVCYKVAPALALAASCLAATAPVSSQVREEPPVVNSDLSAPLFYQLLIGEIELREGAAGTAYDLMLDAARKKRDEQLFRRATEIALQARAGDQALVAVTAWRNALPASLEALRYQVQLLVALNRVPETVEPAVPATAVRVNTQERMSGVPSTRVPSSVQPDGVVRVVSRLAVTNRTS